MTPEQKTALWEASKEPLRLLFLAIIPIFSVMLLDVPGEWAVVAIAVLRFIDKLLHELGKESGDKNLELGLTRF